MTTWAVSIDTATVEPVTEEQLLDLANIMAAREGAVAGDGSHVTGTFTVVAANATDALAQALRTWRLELDSQHIRAGIDTAVEVMTTDEQDARLAVSPMPEIWSTPEVADELRVSRQRVHQLIHDNSRFPPPLARLGSGPIWLANSIRAFNSTWERKPGRPARATVA